MNFLWGLFCLGWTTIFLAIGFTGGGPFFVILGIVGIAIAISKFNQYRQDKSSGTSHYDPIQSSNTLEHYVDLAAFTKKSLFDEEIARRATNRFVVIDFETTGLDRAYDRIVEISARRYEDGYCADRYETLVNPGRSIPASSTEIHHITNEMVKKAPTEHEAIWKLHFFIGNDIIVAHNADFDIEFLHNAYIREGLEAHNDYIDTLAIARKLYALSNYKLGTIGKYLGYETDNLHRAGSDTKICGAIVVDALEKINRTSILDGRIGEFSDVDMEYLRAINQVLVDSEVPLMHIAVRRSKSYIIICCAGYDFLRIKTTGRAQYLLVKTPAPAIEKLTDGQFCVVPAPPSDGEGYNRVIVTSPEDIPALGKLICSICPAA